MVRLGGLTYAIDPARRMGRRILDIRVAGRALDPDAPLQGDRLGQSRRGGRTAGLDVVADYLRSVRRVKLNPRARAESYEEPAGGLCGLVLSVLAVGLSLVAAVGDDALDDLLTAFQMTPLGDRKPTPFTLIRSTASRSRSPTSAAGPSSSTSGRAADHTARGVALHDRAGSPGVQGPGARDPRDQPRGGSRRPRGLGEAPQGHRHGAARSERRRRPWLCDRVHSDRLSHRSRRPARRQVCRRPVVDRRRRGGRCSGR